MKPHQWIASSISVKCKIMALSTTGKSLFDDADSITELIAHGRGPSLGSPQSFYDKQVECLSDKAGLRAANIRVLKEFGTILGYDVDHPDIDQRRYHPDTVSHRRMLPYAGSSPSGNPPFVLNRG
ncbi:uncharacterized protein JCM6883_007580 [Sporobolomyces salmoneus]|uniref:uncharacterized protein n=1 Tax=Sporobolomyces salmoneus TaxID=183962 RepID=UPI00316F8F67